MKRAHLIHIGLTMLSAGVLLVSCDDTGNNAEQQQEEAAQPARPPVLTVDEAMKRLKQYGFLDIPQETVEPANKNAPTMFEMIEGNEKARNPMPKLSKAITQHYLRYKNGDEQLNAFPYIAALLSLRVDNDIVPHSCIEAFLAAGVDANGVLTTEHAKGIGVQQKDSTPLLLAIEQGRREIVELLFQYGATIEASSKVGLPLLTTVEENNSDILKILLKQQANIEETNVKGWTPLYYAAYKGYKDIVQILIEHKANVNVVVKNGETPLSVAAGGGQSARISLSSNSDKSKASADDYIAISRVLLENGANPDSKNENGETPLMKAVSVGNVDGVKMLLDHKIDINAKDNRGGATALIKAVVGGVDAEIIRLLLEKGASVDETDVNGDTALSLLCAPRSMAPIRIEILKLLLNAGADAIIENRKGMTALRLMVDRDDEEALLCVRNKKIEEYDKSSSQASTAIDLDEAISRLSFLGVIGDKYRARSGDYLMRGDDLLSHYKEVKKGEKSLASFDYIYSMLDWSSSSPEFFKITKYEEETIARSLGIANFMSENSGVSNNSLEGILANGYIMGATAVILKESGIKKDAVKKFLITPSNKLNPRIVHVSCIRGFLEAGAPITSKAIQRAQQLQREDIVEVLNEYKTKRGESVHEDDASEESCQMTSTEEPSKSQEEINTEAISAIKELVREFVETQSTSGRDAGYLKLHYPVSYIEDGLQNREFVLNDRQVYARKFPIRKFTCEEIRIDANSDSSEWRVTTRHRAVVRSAKGKKMGFIVEGNYIVRNFHEDGYKICSINERILQKFTPSDAEISGIEL